MIVAARSNWELNYDNKARKAAIFVVFFSLFFFFSISNRAGYHSSIVAAKWRKTRARAHCFPLIVVTTARRILRNVFFFFLFFYLPHIQFILRCIFEPIRFSNYISCKVYRLLGRNCSNLFRLFGFQRYKNNFLLNYRV